jgi:hypothetical protein
MAHIFVDDQAATKANLDSLLPPTFTQVGNLSITPVANTPTSVYVKFPAPFVAIPTVVASPNTLAIGSEVKQVTVSSVTTAGFTVWVYRTNTTKLTVNWQAWGDPPATFTTGQPAYASLLNAASASKLVTKCGVVNITPVANTPTVQAVSFGVTFAAPPNVVLSASDVLIGSQVKCVGLSSNTKTGFNARLYRTNTTVTSVIWIATGRL